MFTKKTLLIAMAFLPICANVLTAEESGLIGNSVEQIKRFAPDGADLLIVVRPKRLMASTFLKAAASVNPERATHFPKNVEQIELILALASTQEVFPQQPAEPIAEPDGLHPALRSASNTFASVIRFEAPVPVTTLTDWFAQQPERLGLEAYMEEPTFRKETWNGHEVFHCAEAIIPSIHRLDPRTFIVANSPLMRKRLEHPSQIDTPIDAWLQPSRLSGDIVIAADLTSIDTAGPRLRSGVPLENVESAGLRLDFSGPELLTSQCRLSKAEHAQKLLQTFESYRKLGIAGVEAQLNRAGTVQEKWLARQAVPILRSFKIGAQGNAVMISLPRPKNWDTLVAGLAANVIETRKSHEAKMKEALSSRRTTKVLVIKRQLARGETIEAGDVLIEEWPADRVPKNAFTSAVEVVGSKAKREIFAGEPLVSSNVFKKSATVPVAKP